MPFIKRKIKPDSFVYTDSYRSYNALDVSEFKHFGVNHSKEFTCGKTNHINGIENFWNQSKRTLRKYNRIDKKHFHLFLKDCEFRFNYGTPSNQLKTLRKWCDIQSLSTTAPFIIISCHSSSNSFMMLTYNSTCIYITNLVSISMKELYKYQY